MLAKLRHILVPTDFSHAADLALHRAAQIAREHRARIALVHAIDVPSWRSGLWVRPTARQLQDLERAARQRLKSTAASISRQYGIRALAAVERGHPARQIAIRAQRFGTDLIVLGAHGAHSVLDTVLGTVAQQVLRLAHEAVLIVRTVPRAPYREVLLPCDGSPSSRAAVRFARLAFPDAHYVLANVVNVPFEGFLTRGGTDQKTLERYRHEFQQQASTRLRALAVEAGLGEKWTLRLRRGYVPGQILDMAQDLVRGVIVMGAHGYHPIAAMLLGSVSSHVASEAPCDVMLVKEGAIGVRGRGQTTARPKRRS
jgi:CPA2 family monovalent cation:H+ antiporter-2